MTPTERQHVNDWLIAYQYGTRTEYRREVEAFADWYEKPILDATRTDIQRWLGELTEQDLKPGTLRRKASTLSSFYNWCVAEKIIEHNPCEHLRRPTGDPEPQRGLDADPARTLLTAAAERSKTARALTWLLCGVGLRVSEACRAAIEDLDSDQALLTVTVKGGHIQSKPLSAPVLTAIQPSINGRTSGTILTNREGNPLAPQRAWEIVNKLSKTTGIDCHPHTFRHTAATLALEAGAEVQDVQQLLGHASIETTLRYIRNRDILGGMRTAADRLGAVLSGADQ